VIRNGLARDSGQEHRRSAASATIVDTVLLNGKPCMENGTISGVDFAKLRDAAWAAGEVVWATLLQWDRLAAVAEEVCRTAIRKPA
jgi:hypothetical protein